MASIESVQVLVFCASFAAMWPAGTSLAQEVEAPPPELEAGDADIEDLSLENLLNISVNTSSLRAQPFAWAPNNSVVITRAQIRQRGYVSLKDVLADLPGVDVYNNYSEEISALVSIRGNPNSSAFVILQDGMRVSPPGGEPWPIDDNYPVFDAKQVEVIYGPASALYGTDALSGIINIISDEAVSKYGATAKAAYGSNQYAYGAAEAHGELPGHVRLRLSGHYHRSRNSNLALEYPSDFPAASFQQLLDPFSGEVMISDRSDSYYHGTSSLRFNALARLSDNFELGFDERRFNMPTSNNVHPQYTRYGTESQFISRKAHAKYSDQLVPGLRSDTTLSASFHTFGDDYSFDNYFSGYSPIYKVSDAESISLQQQLSYDLAEGHSLIGGFSYMHLESTPYSIDLTSKPDGDRPLAAQGFKIPGTELPAPFFDVSMFDVAGYFQLQSQWATWVSTTLGLRYDFDSRYGSTLNPRAGVVVQLGEGHTLKVLYGEGFLAPSTYSQYPLFGAFIGTDAETGKPHADWYHLPNPDLEPLKSRTIEAGDTLLITDDLMFNATIYYTVLRNRIINVTTFEREEFAGGIIEAVERSQSLGSATLWGGTLGLDYKLREGPWGLDVWATYTLSRGRSIDSADGKEVELAYNTEHKVKGGVGLHYRNFHLTTLARYSGETTHNSFVDEAQTRRLRVPESLVIDSTLLADEVFDQASLALTVRNLTDAHYYSPGSMTPVNLPASPQETRQIMLTLSYKM